MSGARSLPTLETPAAPVNVGGGKAKWFCDYWNHSAVQGGSMEFMEPRAPWHFDSERRATCASATTPQGECGGALPTIQSASRGRGGGRGDGSGGGIGGANPGKGRS